jgi:diacylglycerol kinase family enzyme
MEQNRPKKFAVILNENARKVSHRVRRSAQRIVPSIALYSSRTKEDAYQVVKDALDRGYHRIISGGGDGTFSHLLSEAKRYLEEKNARLHKMGRQAREGLSRLSLPEFGILKLGTGNSLAPILGIRGGLDPVRMLAEGSDFATREINIIEAEGRCFTFSGLGWDAQILNDYLWLTQRLRVPLLSRLAQTLFGYFAAIIVRSIPTVLAQRKPVKVVLRNAGNRLYQVATDGLLQALDCPPGAVFYDGPMNMVGVGTTPYYGFHVKAFPHAMSVPGLMNLRVVNAGVIELLSHAVPVWQGTYRAPSIVDFLVERVDCSFSREVPLQIGGDAEGYRQKISFQVSDLTVDLLDFGRPLLPVEPAAQALEKSASPAPKNSQTSRI